MTRGTKHASVTLAEDTGKDTDTETQTEDTENTDRHLRRQANIHKAINAGIIEYYNA